MPKKTISFKLVEDRYLTKKFKGENQHELMNWLNELAPEMNWESGEVILCGTDEQNNKKMYAFGVYINRDYNTINLAELKADNLKIGDDYLESCLAGKDIVCVMRGECIENKIWFDEPTFQKTMQKAIAEYIVKKEQKNYRG